MALKLVLAVVVATCCLAPGPAAWAADDPAGLDVPAPDVVGAWQDRQSGAFVVIARDGTWTMMNTKLPGTTPRSGNWGTAAEGSITLRTCLAAVTQLWNPTISPAAGQELLRGGFDLTMVWDLKRSESLLTGVLRAGRPRVGPDGGIADFRAWDDPGNDPVRTTWSAVLRPGPAEPLSPEIRKVLQSILQPPEGEAPLGGLFRDWAQEFGVGLGELGEGG